MVYGAYLAQCAIKGGVCNLDDLYCQGLIPFYKGCKPLYLDILIVEHGHDLCRHHGKGGHFIYLFYENI